MVPAFVIMSGLRKLEAPMAKKVLFWLVVAIMMLGSTACFNVHVESDVDFPAGRFSAVWERIGQLQRHNPDRVGRAREMHMLVYDGESRELVSGSFPMWLVKLAGEKNEEHGTRRSHEVASRYVDFDRCSMREISRLGPGLLVQVDDGDEGTHVLLWLE
jgi:hypothetical protein